VQLYKYETDKRAKLQKIGSWNDYNERLYDSLGAELDQLIEDFKDQDAEQIFKQFEWLEWKIWGGDNNLEFRFRIVIRFGYIIKKQNMRI